MHGVNQRPDVARADRVVSATSTREHHQGSITSHSTHRDQSPDRAAGTSPANHPIRNLPFELPIHQPNFADSKPEPSALPQRTVLTCTADMECGLVAEFAPHMTGDRRYSSLVSSVTLEPRIRRALSGLNSLGCCVRFGSLDRPAERTAEPSSTPAAGFTRTG